MEENKTKGKGLSIAMILLVIVLGFGIVIGLTQTSGANNLKNEQSEISNYVFDEEGTLLAYTGTMKDLEIPSTYSLSSTTETAQMSSSSVYNLVEKARSIGLKKYTIENQTGNFTDDFGNTYYQEKYVLTYSKRTTIEGTDYQVKSIGPEAFRNNAQYTSVIIPEGVKTIKSNAFAGCYNLKSITLPESLEIIENSAFYNCNIQEIVIPDSVNYIGPQAFQDCDRLVSVTLPSSLTQITSNMFCNCDNLESITLPSSIRYIESYAFQYCRKLNTINFEEGLENIQSGAFYGCRVLTDITLPSTLNYIGDQAFWQCTALKTITINGNNIANIEYNAFPNTIQKIYVPDDMYEQYLYYGNWPNYQSKITRLSEKV